MVRTRTSSDYGELSLTNRSIATVPTACLKTEGFSLIELLIAEYLSKTVSIDKQNMLSPTLATLLEEPNDGGDRDLIQIIKESK